MSEVRDWNQDFSPTDASKAGNKPPQTGPSHAQETSHPDGSGAVRQPGSSNSRNGEESRHSSEQPTRSRYFVSSFESPGGTFISSRPVAEPSKASSKSPESVETRKSELGGFKSSDHQAPTQPAAQPHPTDVGQHAGQAEPSAKSPSGWFGGIYSRLQGNSPAASQKSPVSVQGSVKSYGACHQSGGLPEKSTALNDHSQLAQWSRFGDFHTMASVSRYYAEPSSAPEPVPSSVEAFFRTLLPGVPSKPIEDILRGDPGLSLPSSVRDYLKKLPAQYKPLPLESIYSHQPTAVPSLSATRNDGSLSRGVLGAQVPTNVRSFLGSLPTEKASLPVNSMLANHPDRLSGELRSFLNGLPPAYATVPIKSVINGVPLPTASISKEGFSASTPMELKSFVNGLPSGTAALPVESILSKLPVAA